MSKPLVADALIEQAMKKTGLNRFDSNSWREGLDVLLADYNSSEHPEPLLERMSGNLVQMLSDRLATTDYLAQRPGLLDRPIERPLFVFGMPRTGTTLLSNLLACDPARRSALTWEIEEPVPPPTTATLKTDPRAIAKLAQEKAMLAAYPDMGKYYRNSAVYPNECMFFMMHDFKGLAYEARGKLPGYRDWLLSTDMSSTYKYHKRFLQLLQADAPGNWNLKMPSHALWLETLLSIYPDARLVWAHRDPFTATSSFCSILSMAHHAGGEHLAHLRFLIGRLSRDRLAGFVAQIDRRRQFEGGDDDGPVGLDRPGAGLFCGGLLGMRQLGRKASEEGDGGRRGGKG